MKQKTALVVVTLLGSMALGLTFLMKRRSETVEVTKVDSHSKSKIGQNSSSRAYSSSPTSTVENLVSVSPWDYHKPLTDDENKEFEVAKTQVQKFLSWGKMDAEAVPTFRQTLFKMGDRAIADLARGLSKITKDDIKDKAGAEAVVRNIDALAYFANSQNPLAADSAEHLAKRPIGWDESGELLNPVEANITFEMFDIFARYRPEKAAQFITQIEKKHRAGYFTHYAYGRKLAGKTMEEIDQELRQVFGSPELALK